MKCAPAPRTLRTLALSLNKATVTGVTPGAAGLELCRTNEARCGSSKSTIIASNFSSVRHEASGYPQAATSTPQRLSSGANTSVASSSLDTKSAWKVIEQLAKLQMVPHRLGPARRHATCWLGSSGAGGCACSSGCSLRRYAGLLVDFRQNSRVVIVDFSQQRRYFPQLFSRLLQHFDLLG